MATAISVNSCETETVIAELRQLQRQRVFYMKFRIKLENNLTAGIASMCGYYAGIESEKERKEAWDKGRKAIKDIRGGFCETDLDSADLIDVVQCADLAIDGISANEKGLQKRMVKLAKQLPVAEWCSHEDRKGFGLLSLATVVGECGDLSNYANPGKLWRRMGLAPYTSKGKVHMGQTWKIEGWRPHSLTAAEWCDFGYSPRRRSIAFNIGECLIKQNGSGPYRRRWIDAKKRAFETHPEWNWKDCEKCGGTVPETEQNPAARKTKRRDPHFETDDSDAAKNRAGDDRRGTVESDACPTCGGLGKKCLHAHKHGMLLATKMLLRDLWIEWNDGGDPNEAWRVSA